MKAKGKAVAAIAEEKPLRLLRPFTSTQGVPSSSHKPRSLVEISGLHPLSDIDVESISKNNTETIISIHNIALQKFTEISAGEYFWLPDKSDAFHGLQTQYKHLVGRSDLVVVHLSDLEVGREPNEFRVLYGELCVDPFRFGRIYTVMKEADTENSIALSIVAPDSCFMKQSDAKRAYPKGTKIALKQPRLVKDADGFKWLDVDNLRSIVRIGRFPESSQNKFQDWFHKGRSAHDAEEWEACVRNYSKCEINLSQTQPESVDRDRMILRFQLHSNRSRAYIELSRYSQAFQDARICCAIYSGLDDGRDPQMMMKAFRLRLESFICLGRYKDGYCFLKNNISLSHNSEDTKSLVHFHRQKCIEYSHMGEAIAGIAESPKDCKPDTDFIGPVEIKDSDKGQGRGLFATEFVKAGTVLLICRALARCNHYGDQVMHSPISNGLLRNVENAIKEKENHVRLLFLSLDPSSANLFKTYCPALPDFAFECPSSLPSKWTIRKKYQQLATDGILGILRTIAFDDMSLENINNWMNPAENRRYYGIWLIPSLINHSCVPNASRINVGDVMSIHASKDINNGEEITIPYFNVLLPYHVRMAACTAWGFTCVCERCRLEGFVIRLDDQNARSYEKLLSTYLKRRRRLSKTNSAPTEGRILVEAIILGQFSEKLDVLLESLEAVFREPAHSMWLRCSFIRSYLARLHINLDQCDRVEYEENAYKKYMNDLTIVKEALLATCPGDIRRLLLDCSSMANYRKIAAIKPEYEGFYQRIFNIKKSCDSVYGCQKPSIVKIILRKLSNSYFY